MTSKQSGAFVVYGWDQYPKGSVLAGQSRKNYLGTYPDEASARDSHPEAKFSSPYFEPQNTFDHLPN